MSKMTIAQEKFIWNLAVKTGMDSCKALDELARQCGGSSYKAATSQVASTMINKLKKKVRQV